MRHRNNISEILRDLRTKPSKLQLQSRTQPVCGSKRCESQSNCREVASRDLNHKSPKLVNPFSPYSIQKHPEPQICPKFVPAIVFRGSVPGNWNLSKICRNLSEIMVFQILTNACLTNFRPPDWNPKNDRWDKFWTNLGFSVFLNAVRGKRMRNPKHSNCIGLFLRGMVPFFQDRGACGTLGARKGT